MNKRATELHGGDRIVLCGAYETITGLLGPDVDEPERLIFELEDGYTASIEATDVLADVL